MVPPSSELPIEPQAVLQSRRAPVEIDAHAIDDWFEERMQKHPWKRDAMLARTVLSEIREATDPAWRAEVARVHDLWCSTEAWNWKGGARAGTFAAWLVDKGWRYEPPAEKSEFERAMDAI